MNGGFPERTDPGVRAYRVRRDVLEATDGQAGGFRQYREFVGGRAVEVFEDPLASRPVQPVNLNRLELRGKWIMDIDEDPDTGEACLILEDPVTKASIQLWMPSHLDRTAFAAYSVNAQHPVEQRPNKDGIDYERLINDRIVPEEPVIARMGQLAMKRLVQPAMTPFEQLARLVRELPWLPRWHGMQRDLF